eukprot:TRINITY_DN3845_c0_g1_i1.p1 TRINITY_DN3845_c0_g1~~TRINITY_DN3845_c0_g1_i1.p1  ORF type:complete len:1561 (-),score=492.20 TRINITY_DN3845_c0_g1_i1:80-4762(-)
MSDSDESGPRELQRKSSARSSDSERSRGRPKSRSRDSSESDGPRDMSYEDRVIASLRSKKKDSSVSPQYSSRKSREIHIDRRVSELDRRELELRRRESLLRRQQDGDRPRSERSKEKKSRERSRSRSSSASGKGQRSRSSSPTPKKNAGRTSTSDKKKPRTMDDTTDEDEAPPVKKDTEKAKEKAKAASSDQAKDEAESSAQAETPGERSERMKVKTVMRFVNLEPLVPVRPDVATSGLNTLTGVKDFIVTLERKLDVLQGAASGDRSTASAPIPRSFETVYEKLLRVADAAFDPLSLPRPVNRTAWDIALHQASGSGPTEFGILLESSTGNTHGGFLEYRRGDDHLTGFGGQWWGVAAWREVERQSLLDLLEQLPMGDEKRHFICDVCGSVTPKIEEHYGDCHDTHPNNNTRYFKVHKFENASMKHLVQVARAWFNRHTADEPGGKGMLAGEAAKDSATAKKMEKYECTAKEEHKEILREHRKTRRVHIDSQLALHIFCMDTPLAQRFNLTLLERGRTTNAVYAKEMGANNNPAADDPSLKNFAVPTPPPPPPAGSATTNGTLVWDYFCDVVLAALQQLPCLPPDEGLPFKTCYRACSADVLGGKAAYVHKRTITFRTVTTAVSNGSLANHNLGSGSGKGVLLKLRVRTARSLSGYADAYVGNEVVILPNTWFRIYTLTDAEKNHLGASIGRDLSNVDVHELTEVDMMTGLGVLAVMRPEEVYANHESLPLLNVPALPIDRDARAHTALHLAAKIDGNADVVRLLIKTPIPIDARSNTGHTALHMAISGHTEGDTALALLSGGARADIASHQKYLPMHVLLQNPTVLPLVFDALMKAGGLPTSTPKERDFGVTEDTQRTTPLLLLTASHAMEERMLQPILTATPLALRKHVDQFGSSGAHLICANQAITLPGLRQVLDFYVPEEAAREEKNDQDGSYNILNERDGYGLTPVLHLCGNEKATMGMIDLLLQRGAKVSSDDEGITDRDGKGCIGRATSWQHREVEQDIIRLLVEKGDRMNHVDGDGQTPIHQLLMRQDVSLDDIEAYVRHGADLSHKGYGGQTVLHTYFKNLALKDDIAMYLFRNAAPGAVEAADDDGYTPLHYAVSNRGITVDILKALLQKGAKVEATEGGQSCLQLAIGGGGGVKPDVLAWLLENGAAVSGDGASSGEHPLLTYLGEVPAPVAADDEEEGGKKNDETPTDGLQKDVVEMLVKKSGDVAKLQDHEGMGVLHYAARRTANVEILKILLKDTWGSINAPDRTGRTALHFLCAADHVSVAAIEVLLEKNGDIGIEDHYGMTPVHAICQNHKLTPEVLTALLSGAKSSKAAQAYPPQDGVRAPTASGEKKDGAAAASGANTLTAKILNRKDGSGRTPAHFICANEPALAEPLLLALAEAGANFSIVDDDGNSCVHLVSGNRKCTVPMVSLLMHTAFTTAGNKNRKKQTALDIADALARKDLKKEIRRHMISRPQSRAGEDGEEEEEAGEDGEEEREYEVKLVRYDETQRIPMIRALMALKPSVTTKAAAKMVEKAPCILSKEKKEFAFEMKAKLEACGASILLL